MTCGDFDLLCQRVVRGEFTELTRAERDGMRRHTSQCPSCKSHVEKKMAEERDQYGDMLCDMAIMVGAGMRAEDLQDPEVGS